MWVCGREKIGRREREREREMGKKRTDREEKG